MSGAERLATKSSRTRCATMGISSIRVWVCHARSCAACASTTDRTRSRRGSGTVPRAVVARPAERLARWIHRAEMGMRVSLGDERTRASSLGCSIRHGSTHIGDAPPAETAQFARAASGGDLVHDAPEQWREEGGEDQATHRGRLAGRHLIAPARHSVVRLACEATSCTRAEQLRPSPTRRPRARTRPDGRQRPRLPRRTPPKTPAAGTRARPA